MFRFLGRLRKQGYRFWFLASVPTILALASSFANGADSCRDILDHGIMDTDLYQSDERFRSDYHKWLCTTDFKTHQDASNAGIGLGMVVYGIPINVSGSFSQSQRDEWKQTNCNTEDFRQSSESAVLSVRSHLSTVAVTAWERCMTSPVKGRGIECGIQESGSSATFSARYVPNGFGDSPPTVTSFLHPGAQCQPDSLATIPYGGVFVLCTRTNENVAVTLLLNTDKGPCRAEWHAKALPPPPPPAERTVYDWRMTGIEDCSGTDRGDSHGSEVPVAAQCREDTVGLTAVCWDRANYVNGGDSWCTYKSTPASACRGGGRKGILYECVSHSSLSKYAWRPAGPGDCSALDVASSHGSQKPADARCNAHYAGTTAVCWNDAAGGWCTYKAIESTQCNGGGAIGQKYRCAPATD